MKIDHSASDFFLISNPESVSVKNPVFITLFVKESLIFYCVKGESFSSIFEA